MNPTGNTHYASRYSPGKPSTVMMHREILNVLSGVQTDHINGDGLDNRRRNLRTATNAQNQMNRKCFSGGTSKYRGVSWRRDRGKWQSAIKLDGRSTFLGEFDNEAAAALAYNTAAATAFGDFANLNHVEASRD